MATFIYKAKRSTAETVSGQITAQNREEAIDLINQLGLLPVSVEQKSAEKVSGGIGLSKNVSIKQIYLFSKQLANLLKSGMTLFRALNIVGEQTANVYFRSVIEQIALNIKNGKTFSGSLREYPEIFSSLYVTMVHAGEESGNLQEMLISVASYQKNQLELQSKIKTALAYPILMLLVGIGTVYFILTFVLPKMSGLFESIGSSLPLPTQVLLSISHVCTEWGFGILILLLFVGVVIEYWKKTEKGKLAFSHLMLKVPVVGEVLLKTDISRFCRTLHLLLKSGVTILRALEITIPLLSNDLIKKDLNYCRQQLTVGGEFGSSLKESKNIPPLVGHLITVGEESGNIHDVLNEIADSFEQEVNEKIKVMTTLLEPVMILGVGLIIGFIVFSMLLPIFQIDVLVK